MSALPSGSVQSTRNGVVGRRKYRNNSHYVCSEKAVNWITIVLKDALRGFAPLPLGKLRSVFHSGDC